MDRYTFLASRIPAFAGLVDGTARAQVRWITRIVGPAPRRILDAGCGGGRHSILLSQEGYDVVGVDASESALAIARGQAAELGATPTWVRADLRAPPAGPYDAVLLMDVTLGVFDDAEARAALRELREHLRPGGAIIVELYHLPFWRERLGKRSWAKGELLPDQAVERTYREEGGFLIDEVELISDAGVERAPTQRLRAWSPDEAIGMVTAAGFLPLHTLGSRRFEFGRLPTPLAPDAAFFWIVATR